jgi:hypothetical protein
MDAFDLDEWFEVGEFERCPSCEQPTLLRGTVSGSRVCLTCQRLIADRSREFGQKPDASCIEGGLRPGVDDASLVSPPVGSHAGHGGNAATSAPTLSTPRTSDSPADTGEYRPNPRLAAKSWVQPYVLRHD